MSDREYDNYVEPGQTIGCIFKWRNDGSVGFNPRFRIGLRKSGLSSWEPYGPWVDSGIVAPDQEVTVEPRVQIPTNWNHDASPIAVKLTAEAGSHFGETVIRDWADDTAIHIIKASPDWITVVDATLYNED